MKVDYKGKYKNKVQSNLQEVLNEIETKEMEKKITNFSEKFLFPFLKVKQKIKEDEMFRCFFIKEPGKQNFHQNLAANYIKSLQGVLNFQVLPAGGKNAIYIENGKLFEGKDLKEKGKDVKSVDFQWNSGKYTIYASHKYTGDEGGSQDNQYKDIQNFLKNTRDCNLKNTLFLAICDGEYYLRKDSKTGDNTRLERLARLTDNKTCFVITIEQLEEFIKKRLES